jgi:hypothetical protein
MIQDVLDILIAERNRLDRAIAVLQEGGSGAAEPARRGPGRPKGSGKKAAKSAKAKKAGRHGFTAAQRKAQSEKMKAYWAARRKGK